MTSIKMLSDYDGSRDNNYTIVRLIFAWIVLVGHSFPITGHGADPISAWMIPYAWVGGLAVNGFFAISGFLVTASFAQRGAGSFISARVLRLYPGVIVYSLIAILIIGPIAAPVDLHTYFQADPWANMKNALLWDWKYNLPYAFSSNPFPGATNGSSWSLPAEVRCYVLVLAMGVTGILKNRITANAALLALLVMCFYAFDDIPMFAGNPNNLIALLFFIMGALAWVNRQWIPLTWPLALAAVIVQFAFAMMHSHWFLLVHGICLTYLVFWIVYRTPRVNMEWLGDISFGVYLYAWPIQQLVWRQGQGSLTNAALATLIVVPLAWLSWKVVEQPALNLRGRFARRNELRAA